MRRDHPAGSPARRRNLPAAERPRPPAHLHRAVSCATCSEHILYSHLAEKPLISQPPGRISRRLFAAKSASACLSAPDSYPQKQCKFLRPHLVFHLYLKVFPFCALPIDFTAYSAPLYRIPIQKRPNFLKYITGYNQRRRPSAEACEGSAVSVHRKVPYKLSRIFSLEKRSGGGGINSTGGPIVSTISPPYYLIIFIDYSTLFC